MATSAVAKPGLSGDSAMGNNLGLERLSNLFMDCVPSQQTYLSTSHNPAALLICQYYGRLKTRATGASFLVLC